ncbi:MAG: hypothetical protein K6G89_06945 [Clostridia bacterium]|nr:hypothetical protein [Clostridia bacterium]
MKRSIIAIILLISICILCSCSLFEGWDEPSNATADPSSPSSEEAQEQLISFMNGSIDLDSLSLDGLLELYDEFLKNGNDALNDGTENDLLYKDVEIKPNDPQAEIDFEYPADSQTAVFSDGPWEDKTYEALDPTVNMSDEDKAGYEAAIKALDDFDAEEFQSGIDEMLKSLEGFEDYDPDSYGTGDDPALQDEWPDNEITKQVPKPPFEDPVIVAGGDSVTVMQYGSTAEEAKAYADQLKNAGFTKDVYEDSNEIAGFVIYTFTAENQKGISVSLTFTSGTTTVNFSKD